MADAGSSINGFAPLDRLETTTDRLTGRAGLALFSRYLRHLGIFPFLDRLFGSIRKSGKGLPVPLLFHQLFCFFLDGTNLSLTRFDELAEDGGLDPDPPGPEGAEARGWTPELVRFGRRHLRGLRRTFEAERDGVLLVERPGVPAGMFAPGELLGPERCASPREWRAGAMRFRALF